MYASALICETPSGLPSFVDSTGALVVNKSGIVLIMLGCLFLAANFGLLQWAWLRAWWPLILSVAGVWSLTGPGRLGRHSRCREEKHP